MREGPPSDHSFPKTTPLGPVRRTTTEGPTAKSPRREGRESDQRGGKELPRHQNHSAFTHNFSDQHSVSETASGENPEEPTETRVFTRANLRLGRNRPSTGRGPGSDPGPPCAFETSMIKVSCNSH